MDNVESMLAERAAKDEEREKQESSVLGPAIGMPLMITNGPQVPQYTGIPHQQNGPGIQGLPQQFNGMQIGGQFNPPGNYAGMNGFPPQNFH